MSKKAYKGLILDRIMSKRVILVFLFMSIMLISGCSSYFGDKAVASRIVDKETLLLQRMDVNDNQEIDTDDFFAFTNAFDAKKGGGVNANNYMYTPGSMYNGYDRLDFNDNYAIDQDDFFMLSERFGKKVETALSPGVLIGDFNQDGCVSLPDLEKADADVAALRQQRDAGKFSDVAYAWALKRYDLDNDKTFWSEKDKEALKKRFGEGCKRQQDLGSVSSIGGEGEAAKPALLLDCTAYEWPEKDYCWDLNANDVNNLDAAACGNIQDETLREYCKERVCLFAGNCPEKPIKVYHVALKEKAHYILQQPYDYNSMEITALDLADPYLEAVEFSSEEYAAMQAMDDKVALGDHLLHLLFSIKAPEQANLAKVDFRFEHPQSVKPSIGYLNEITGQLEQASLRSFMPNVFVRVARDKYMRYDAYLAVGNLGMPVVDGKVTFLLIPNYRVVARPSDGLSIGSRDTYVLNQLFEKISFARDENALSQGRFIGVMDSNGKLQSA